MKKEKKSNNSFACKRSLYLTKEMLSLIFKKKKKKYIMSL